MDTPDIAIKGMTMDEFVVRFHEAPFELIDGVCIPMAPVLAGHGERNSSIHEPVVLFLHTNPIGKTYTDTPYVLTYDSNWVTGARVPDIMYFEMSRQAAYKGSNPEWEQKPFVLVPDLCVEIVSKQDSFDDVLGKVARYLDDGFRLVWVVDQKNRLILVHRKGSDQSTTLRIDDTVSVLPGFALRVAEVFG
jgi:Uma2 family endonuclease